MKFLEKAFPWLLLAPAALPVVIWGSLIYPYLVPKTLLFYALGLISLAAFALLVMHGRPFHFARLARPLAWIPAGLLAVAYGTSLIGIDFYRSFWSLLIRGDGLLMLSLATAYFYLILVYADRRFFERYVRAVALVASFVAVYGIGEWLLAGGRIGSLLGNAAFFAGYLNLALFATLIAGEVTPASRTLYRTGALLQVVAIILTATRGTMLALGVVLLAILGYYAGRGAGKARARARIALATLAVLGALFFGFRSELAKVPFSPVARLASIGTNDPDVASRLFIWKNMTGEVAKQPLTGVGAEHINVLFDTFYDPSQIYEEWFDRSHNAFLDYAAQYGVLGFALYLGLIASFFAAARRLAKSGEGMLAGLTALLALSYAVSNFFVFDTISSFILLLSLLALALAASGGEAPREALSFGGLAKGASYAAALVLVLLIIPVSVEPARAAYDLAEAYTYQLVDVSKETSLLSSGFSLGTYADLEYGYTAYDMYANYQASALTGEARLSAYQAAASVLASNYARYPYDARTALYLAQVLSLAPQGASVDQGLLSAALARSIEESPKRAQAWYILANLAIAEANQFPVGSEGRVAGYASAKDILEKYITLVPNLATPHFVLAQLSHANGDDETARAEAAKGKELYPAKGDLEAARRAIAYYEGVNDLPDAAFFLSEAIRFRSRDFAATYDLAKVKFLMGDKAGAEELVLRLRAKDPAIIDTDPAFKAAITEYENSLR